MTFALNWKGWRRKSKNFLKPYILALIDSTVFTLRYTLGMPLQSHRNSSIYLLSLEIESFKKSCEIKEKLGSGVLTLNAQEIQDFPRETRNFIKSQIKVYL